MSDWLYVKNFGELQHYKKRNPPWIKLYRALMTDGKFHQLSEIEQWQLVRIWLVSAEEHPGGWVPNDESWLRRMTGSLRAVPIAKLVDAGWLIPQTASAYASALASTELANESKNRVDVAPQRFRGSETYKEPSLPSNGSREGKEGLEIGEVLKAVAP